MGKKTRNKRNQLLPFEKVFRICSIVLAVLTVLLALGSLLQFLDVISLSAELLPLSFLSFLSFSIESFCSAVYNYRRNRYNAIVSICCGVFVLICVIVGSLI